MQLPELPGYQYEDLLGEDPYGWSFIASHENGERRLIKVLKSQATDESFLKSYFKTFSDTEDPIKGTVQVFDYVIQASDSATAVSTPFFGWKSKNKRWQVTSIKRLGSLFGGDQAFEVIRDLAGSLSNVHREGIFHGGLRPANIFVTGDSEGFQDVLVGDFGQLFMGGLQYLEAGDLLFYVSPEQLVDGDFSKGRGFKWDVYAFGAIAFQILTGHLPRLERLQQQCLKHGEAFSTTAAISNGSFTPVSEHFLRQLEKEKPVEWPDDFADDRMGALRSIIQSCLEFDLENRPSSMVQVSEALGVIWQAEQDAVAVSEEVAPEPFETASLVPVPDQIDPATKFEADPKPLIEMDLGTQVGLIAQHSTEESNGSVDTEAEEAAKPEVTESGFEESEEGVIGDELPDHAGAARSESLDTIEGTFRNRPVLKWQIMAIVAMLCVLPLGVLAIKNYRELQTVEQEATIKTTKLQASVDEQAEAYLNELARNQENSEQLKSELDEAEDSHSRLLGEATLARQILRQTQENGDEFFNLILDNRDTDVPGFREKRAAALVSAQKHYERLIEVYGDAPDFIISTANAYFYLGRIYREMGMFGRSLGTFDEAERRYLALLEDSRTESVEFIRNLAIAKRALGQLSAKDGKYAIARHYFTESSRFWAEARATDDELLKEAGVSIHENSLSVVVCEYAIGRYDAALDATRSVGAQLLKLQESDPGDARVIGALAHSFSLGGRIMDSKGEVELAKESYQQSADLYAQSVKLNAAADEYQLGLGNSLARVGLLSRDIDKLKAAVEILGRVVVHHPFEPSYQKILADVYGVLARDQRDGGRLSNAIELEQEAISILRPIVRNTGLKTPPDVLYTYSLRLAHLAELLGDEGDFDESREPLVEAISVLEKISEQDKSITIYRRALARARGLAGFACLKSGDKSGAKEHLELAKAEWESYVQANPQDIDAKQAVRWTTDQLRGL